jgi:hypothetical protein
LELEWGSDGLANILFHPLKEVFREVEEGGCRVWRWCLEAEVVQILAVVEEENTWIGEVG